MMTDYEKKTIGDYNSMIKEQSKGEAATESIEEEGEELDSITPSTINTVPDGGYGWFIVLAAVIVQIVGLGVGQSW